MRTWINRLSALALLATIAFAGTAKADTLTTAPSNNGTGGVFINLTASGPNNLVFESFGAPFGSAAGSAVNIEVYSRPGSYVGFTTSNVGWSFLGTVSGTSAGTVNFSAPINLPSPIALAQGTTTGIYLHGITVGGGLRYTGLAATPPQTTWPDANITLFGDVARTGNVAFGGTAFTPRTFSGFINYSIAAVPEPTTMALCGLALCGGGYAGWRRRKSGMKAAAANRLFAKK